MNAKEVLKMLILHSTGAQEVVNSNLIEKWTARHSTTSLLNTGMCEMNSCECGCVCV